MDKDIDPLSDELAEYEGVWSPSRAKCNDLESVTAPSLSRTQSGRSDSIASPVSPRQSISQSQRVASISNRSSRRSSRRMSDDAACCTPAQAYEKLQKVPTTSSTTERNRSIGTIYEDEKCSDGARTGSGASNEVDDEMYQDPLETTRCLQEFQKVLARQKDPRRAAEKKFNKERHQKLAKKHGITLSQLNAWAKWKSARATFAGRIKYYHYHGPSPKQPLVEDLVDMTEYYYPQRKNFKAYVCDFKDGSLERKDVDLGQIDSYLEDLPPDGVVRWIHCPIGIGLLHSTMEDRFLCNKRQDASSFTGHAAFPYTHFETLALCARKHLEVMHDVQTNIRIHKEFAPVKTALDASALEGLSSEIKADVTWRAKHWHLAPDFWTMVCSDFPRQLSSGDSLEVDPVTARRLCSAVNPQTMSKDYFKDAHVVRQPFRLFHSSDGVVLTMGDCNGIDFLDANMSQYLSDPAQCIYDNEDASAIGLMFELFASTGTRTWYKRNVEWFMIYLLTEIIATPHNYRQGCNAPNLARAYVDVVQDLKERRYLEFRPNESVKLVREYLACIDEISSIHSMVTHSLETLKELNNQHDLLDWIDSDPDNPAGMSARQRIAWAAQAVREAEQVYRTSVRDLRRDLDALFQLRSIEQNERSIITDSQNKAILLFTAVTVIFLPLSFFTSYYGMNLRGIVDTNKTEGYFWRVCGIIAFAIVLLVSTFAFRHRVRDIIHARRMALEGAQARLGKYDMV